MSNTQHIQSAIRTLQIEAQAIEALIALLDDQFEQSCDILLCCEGRVVVTGMGKSGHIGGKIAATLASTGTPAFFMHPGEASHGDLGMITAKDVVLAISNSGTTAEVVGLIPTLKRIKTPMIAMTGVPDSTLANAANAHINISVQQEACPLGLAPTSSTTATLAMGDALAVALLEARGFTAEDFAFSHPGGALGKKLLLKVADVMVSDEAIPMVAKDSTIKDALLEITRKNLGMTTVVNDDKKLLGVFTDGDIRRTLDLNINLSETSVSKVMTRHGKTCRADMLAAEAMGIMEDSNITSLPVVNSSDIVVGAIHLHELIKAGLV